MNGWNVGGLLLSTVGSFLFIVQDWKDRHRKHQDEAPLHEARYNLYAAQNHYDSQEALYKFVDAYLTTVDPVDEAALPEPKRQALAESRARRVNERTRHLHEAKMRLQQAQARLDELTKPLSPAEQGKAVEQSNPPNSHYYGAVLIFLGFVLQLIAACAGQ